MTEPRPSAGEPPPVSAEVIDPYDAGVAPVAGPGTAPIPAGPTNAPGDEAFQRRAFVRRMGNDAVRTASTVFGLSRILTRSAAAAGQAVMGELEAIQGGSAGGRAEPGSEGATPLSADSAASEGESAAEPSGSTIGRPAETRADEPAAAGTADQLPRPAFTDQVDVPAPLPQSRSQLLLDDEQRAILEGASDAIVAVNREGHSPQMTTATVAWDGQWLRFATLGWSRRTTMLRSDPRVALLVEGPGDGRFVTVTGRARIVEGRIAAVRDAAWPLLLRAAGAGGEAAADARWQELLGVDPDRAVIIVEPDQVLSGRR